MSRKRHGAGRHPVRRPGVHEGIDLELEHHIAERTDRLIAQGWSADEARAEAERRFGALDAHRTALLAEARDGPGGSPMWQRLDAVLHDVRYALRGLRMRPGFALTLITTLALGIGATGAIFSVIDAAMLRPLPFDEPDRLVDVRPTLPDAGGLVLNEFQTDQVAPWIKRASFLADITLHSRVQLLRTDGDAATEVTAVAASHTLDELLGVTPAMGRMIEADDEARDRRVAVLSWDYWSQRGSDPDAVGRTMELDDHAWTVIGVLPRGVRFPVAGTTDLWIPRSSDGTVLGVTRSQTGVVGRLLDDLDLPVAQQRADALGRQLAEAQPSELGWKVTLSPIGASRAGGDTARGLWMVGGAVALMLVIALVNGTNLLLVRGQARLAEIGVRKALGASRARIMRQVLIESVLSSLAGGAAATGVAWVGVEAIRVIAPRELTFSMLHDFGLESRALLAIFLVAAFSGLLVGVLPGLSLATARVAGSGAAGARARNRGGARLRSALVVAEVAVSVVLLVGAGLFVRSFAAMNRVDLGMDTDKLAMVTVDLPRSRYPDPPARAAFVASFLPRLRSIPTVTSAAVGMGTPPEGGGISFGAALQAEGREPIDGQATIPFVTAGPDYFATLGTTLVDGRLLRPGDRERDGVVIDQDLATDLFGAESAIGRRFTMNGGEDDIDWMTVVGVVEELALGGPDDHLGAGALAYPLDLDAPSSYLTFVVRGGGRAPDLIAPMRAALQAEDQRLPVVHLRTGREAMSEALVRPRFLVLLMSILAGLALLLASVGIYGVISFAVRRRSREMGIRMALGAPAGQVLRAVVSWGLLLALAGTALGLGAALLLDDVARALLFGVAPGDTATLVVVAATMLAITALASLIPARRATRVDPVEVLRSE